MNTTQIWLQFQNRLICPERIHHLDEQLINLVKWGYEYAQVGERP
jgi:hypothetical protein